MADEGSVFNRLISDSIKEGLERLGHNMAHTILYHIEKTERISRQEVIHNIDLFARGLQRIFNEGAKIIEGLIIEKLNENLGLNKALNTDKTLQEYVEEARSTLLFEKKNGQLYKTPYEHRFP